MTDLSARLHDLLCTRHCAMCGERLSSGEHALCSVCNACLPRTGYDASPADNDMAHMFWGRIPIERCGALFFYKEGTEKVPFFYDQNGKCLRFVTSLSANHLNKAKIDRK